jgi:hypothetical protein
MALSQSVLSLTSSPPRPGQRAAAASHAADRRRRTWPSPPRPGRPGAAAGPWAAGHATCKPDQTHPSSGQQMILRISTS